MPLPVLPDTWQVRFIITGSPLQRPATFALHFTDTVGTQTATNLLDDLDARATAAMWNLLSSNVGVTKLNAIKLDGFSASVDRTIAAFPAKWTGNGGTDTIPQGAAVLSIKSTQRGPANRNRAYLGPVAETQSTDGTLVSTQVALCQTAWNTFQTNMATDGWAMAMVSPSLVAREHPVSLVIRPYLKTQRRRARR